MFLSTGLFYAKSFIAPLLYNKEKHSFIHTFLDLDPRHVKNAFKNYLFFLKKYISDVKFIPARVPFG